MMEKPVTKLIPAVSALVVFGALTSIANAGGSGWGCRTCGYSNGASLNGVALNGWRLNGVALKGSTVPQPASLVVTTLVLASGEMIDLR